MFFKILIIFITLTQSLKNKKTIIVLENSFFVLENVKKSKKNKKIIFFYKIKKNIDFTIKFVIFNNFRPI
jgi:site-specific DNA-cytosine methylase